MNIETIIQWGSDTIPSGFLLCDGSAVSRTTYKNLFDVIGTNFGEGDGSTTFNLPDLRGRIGVGKSSETEFDNLGETGGEKTHTLTVDEMPQHSHKFVGSEGDTYDDAYINYNGAIYSDYPAFYKGATYTSSGVLSLDKTGGSQPHNILQPYVVTNYIIKALSKVTTKISELNELSTGADNDYLAVVDTSESETKKISLENLKDYVSKETTYNLTFNSTYIYDTDLSYICVKIGNIVILNIRTLGFKLANYAVTDEVLITGLPAPISPIIFNMYGALGAKGDTGRFRLDGEGQIVSWYGNIEQYGSSANKQYSCNLVYLTND